MVFYAFYLICKGLTNSMPICCEEKTTWFSGKQFVEGEPLIAIEREKGKEASRCPSSSASMHGFIGRIDKYKHDSASMRSPPMFTLPWNAPKASGFIAYVYTEQCLRYTGFSLHIYIPSDWEVTNWSNLEITKKLFQLHN